MAYLLDTNVFITAKQRYYGFQLCPGFWDWLIDANGRGLVFSHQQVLSELTADSNLGRRTRSWSFPPNGSSDHDGDADGHVLGYERAIP
jgi:hypothetical protein